MAMEMKSSPPAKEIGHEWSDETEETILKHGDVLVLPNGMEVKLLDDVKLTYTRRNIHAATD